MCKIHVKHKAEPIVATQMIKESKHITTKKNHHHRREQDNMKGTKELQDIRKQLTRWQSVHT